MCILIGDLWTESQGGYKSAQGESRRARTQKTGIEPAATKKKEFSFVPGRPDTFLYAAGEYSGQFQTQTQSQCMDGGQVHVLSLICPASDILCDTDGKSGRKMRKRGGIFLLLNYE